MPTKITFCDFWEDGAYEFTLSWGGETKSGDHWDLIRDKVWYMGCFIRYDGIWRLTGNSADKIDADFQQEMIERIIVCEAENKQTIETYRNAKVRSN